MIGVIQVFFLVLVILALFWCGVLLVSINRMDRNRCACGHYSLKSFDSYTQYTYDEVSVYIHSNTRCYPYLEEIV